MVLAKLTPVFSADNKTNNGLAATTEDSFSSFCPERFWQAEENITITAKTAAKNLKWNLNNLFRV